jgi:hypothetical protein
MNLKDLSKPLPIESVEFRIQSITQHGKAILLAYKDARVDMQRLDDVVGPHNWKREHLRDNKNCIVSIWCEEKKEWISKEDTGAESFTEKEKGLASDSFKRACFNWGIGRELYDYPFIQVQLNEKEFYTQAVGQKTIGKASWGLKLKEWTWGAKFEGNTIVHLAAMDQNNKVRFNWKKK